jgi:hypothetical protein
VPGRDGVRGPGAQRDRRQRGDDEESSLHRPHATPGHMTER